MLGKRELRFILGILIAACLLMAARSFAPRESGRNRIEAMQKEDAQKAEGAGMKDDPAETPEATAAPEPEETVEPKMAAAPEVEETAEPEMPAAPQLENTAQPAGPAFAGPMPAAPKIEVRGYVVITLTDDYGQTRRFGEPIPMDRDKIITVRQSDDKINRIHITPDSVEMDSSTCANQDCVGEGVITLENYKTRILSTYIICLPNGVQVEMIPVVE